jgi:general secretion pathway protein I
VDLHAAVGRPEGEGSEVTSSKRSAFTLVEVLVALAIFAIAGVVIATSYANVLGSHSAIMRRDDREPAMRLVRDAFRAEADRMKIEAWNDIVLPDSGRARWRAVLESTPIADLFDVTLEVELTLNANADAVTVTEKMRLLRPTWSDPAEREALRADSRAKLMERQLP